jgi:predicted transcriptional regulator
VRRPRTPSPAGTAVLRALVEHPHRTRRQLARLIGRDPDGVLTSLRRSGLIARRTVLERRRRPVGAWTITIAGLVRLGSVR